jgi:hypothetical protein
MTLTRQASRTSPPPSSPCISDLQRSSRTAGRTVPAQYRGQRPPLAEVCASVACGGSRLGAAARSQRR